MKNENLYLYNQNFNYGKLIGQLETLASLMTKLTNEINLI